MRKILIISAIAIIMIVPGLTGRLHAGGNGIGNGAAAVEGHSVIKESPKPEKKDEESGRAAEAQKAEKTKKSEEEKKAVEEAKENIVARVNGADINMLMLTRAMNRPAPKYVKEGETVTPGMTAKIKREALDKLIFEELAVQEAIKQGINPTPEAIEKVVAQVRQNLRSEQGYREYLDNAGLTEDSLKKIIERRQRYELITAREVYGKVKVEEKLLQNEYEKEKNKFVLPDNFVVEDVFFLQGKDEETTRGKAEQILKTIRKNDNDVWKLVLDGSFIVRKINIRKEKTPEIYEAMTDMKVGDLSGVMKNRDGFHIIKVVKKEPSRQATFKEARGAIESKFLVPAQDHRLEEWERELRQNAKVEILLDDKDMEKEAGKRE